MSMEEDLGTLIRMLNPYTDGSKGTMDPHTFVTAAPIPAAAAIPAATPAPTPPPTPSPAPPVPDMTGVWMEVDTRYADDWTFKGSHIASIRLSESPIAGPKRTRQGILYIGLLTTCWSVSKARTAEVDVAS